MANDSPYEEFYCAWWNIAILGIPQRYKENPYRFHERKRGCALNVLGHEGQILTELAPRRNEEDQEKR
jgi:hypothetical protein